MSLYRRVLVLICVGGGGWLAWGEEAPPEAEWLQPALDTVQQAFDDVGLTARLPRALVGGGAGALAAFLLCGGLWRIGRILSMLFVLGAGAGAGWCLVTYEPTDWLVREFQVEGLIPTMLVTGAAAALLLGLYDLLRPASPDDTTSTATAFRRLFVPVFVVAAGWLAWREVAPEGAEWLQPTLDKIQATFDQYAIQPRLSRALVGAGAAGAIAFLLGGALWLQGRFIGMLVLLGAGAAAGWAMTTEPLADWVRENLGVEGLIPALTVGTAGAGLLLGLIEWLRPGPSTGGPTGWRTIVKNDKVEVAVSPRGKKLRLSWPGSFVELNYEPLRRDPAALVAALTRTLHEYWQPTNALSSNDYDRIFAAIQEKPAGPGKAG